MRVLQAGPRDRSSPSQKGRRSLLSRSAPYLSRLSITLNNAMPGTDPAYGAVQTLVTNSLAAIAAKAVDGDGLGVMAQVSLHFCWPWCGRF